jgi:hypothetical protein
VNKQICSYDGCGKEVCEADKELKQRMHFCQSHHDELAKFIEEGKVPQIVGFWIRANGGAKKLAATF